MAVHFCPALRRHLAHDLLDEEVKLLGAGDRIGAKDGAVERVGLHVEAHRVVHHALRLLEHPPCRRRPGEGDGVLALEMVEQVARAPRR
jgi:hypothetical protein